MAVPRQAKRAAALIRKLCQNIETARFPAEAEIHLPESVGSKWRAIPENQAARVPTICGFRRAGRGMIITGFGGTKHLHAHFSTRARDRIGLGLDVGDRDSADAGPAGAVERLPAAAILHRRLSGPVVRRLSGPQPVH